jgi:hypothetical protein
MWKAPKDLKAWINSWQTLLTVAAQRNVPEAQDAVIWFEDLYNALAEVLPYWIVLYKMVRRAETEGNTLSVGTVSNDLRDEVRRFRTRGEPW